MWRWPPIYRQASRGFGKLAEIVRRIEPIVGGEVIAIFYYSGLYDKACGRLIAVIRPRMVYTLRRDGVSIDGKGAGVATISGDPFTDLKSLSESVRRAGKRIPILGYISYESLVYSEKSLAGDIKPGEHPLAFFIVPESFIDVDLCRGYGELRTPWGDGRALKMDLYRRAEGYGAELLRVSHDRRAFEDIVLKAKERIYDGEVFQIVLSRYKIYRYDGSPMALYMRLLDSLGETPYAYIMGSRDLYVIGASPEPLIIVRNRAAETYPVAGTRRRVAGMEHYIYRRLLSSEKERAEHMMLVDLARNDLGRAALPGSVTVPRLMFPQILPNVVHLVSRVKGILRSFEDSFEALRSLFPAGTVTGAPKHRAMRLISLFEGSPRGAYAGVIGYVEDLYMNFAITIRSAFLTGETLRIQAGAGIVYDSIPRDEYIETENKMHIIERLLR